MRLVIGVDLAISYGKGSDQVSGKGGKTVDEREKAFAGR
jgi:hypothetical protein